jgi:hypothetical protein
VQGVLLLRIEESLYFANIGKIKDMFARIERFGSTDAGASEPTLPPLQVLRSLVLFFFFLIYSIIILVRSPERAHPGNHHRRAQHPGYGCQVTRPALACLTSDGACVV